MSATPHPERIGPRFLETTVELAKGSNAVNTILVDYRGFDTMFEITVLFIAMLGCLGLIMRRKRTPSEFQKGALGVPGFGLSPKDKK
jgi:multisubunit Na+/H+ antiporter MnhB subunit